MCGLQKVKRKNVERCLSLTTDRRIFRCTAGSKLDLESGFNQIGVTEEDKAKTAFITPFGLFEYNRMPFGLCNAPACFARLMQACLNEQIFQILFVYLDDILIFSKTFEEHLERLKMVLKRLRKTCRIIVLIVTSPEVGCHREVQKLPVRKRIRGVHRQQPPKSPSVSQVRSNGTEMGS